MSPSMAVSNSLFLVFWALHDNLFYLSSTVGRFWSSGPLCLWGRTGDSGADQFVVAVVNIPSMELNQFTTLQLCKGLFSVGWGWRGPAPPPPPAQDRMSKWGESWAEAEKKRVSSGEKLSSTSQMRRGVQTGAAASPRTLGSGPTIPSESQTVFHLECRRIPQKFQKGVWKLWRGGTDGRTQLNLFISSFNHQVVTPLKSQKQLEPSGLSRRDWLNVLAPPQEINVSFSLENNGGTFGKCRSRPACCVTEIRHYCPLQLRRKVQQLLWGSLIPNWCGSESVTLRWEDGPEGPRSFTQSSRTRNILSPSLAQMDKDG